MSGESDASTYIEGVGDDVVVLLSTLVLVIVPITTYIARKLMVSNEIHPQNREIVEETRSRIRLDDAVSEENELNNERQYYRNPVCPICLQDYRLPVGTNCGHVFCAQCLITYWRFGNWLGAVQCPVCRQQVTILLRRFSVDDTTDSVSTRTAVTSINEYNRRFSGEPRPLMDYIRDIPALLRHLMGEFFSLGGLVLMFRVRILLCAIAILLYLISPIDFLPEAVFGVIGFLDDIFVVMLILVYITVIYRNVVAARE